MVVKHPRGQRRRRGWEHFWYVRDHDRLHVVTVRFVGVTGSFYSERHRTTRLPQLWSQQSALGAQSGLESGSTSPTAGGRSGLRGPASAGRQETRPSRGACHAFCHSLEKLRGGFQEKRRCLQPGSEEHSDSRVVTGQVAEGTSQETCRAPDGRGRPED